jgi:hypothetical protein
MASMGRTNRQPVILAITIGSGLAGGVLAGLLAEQFWGPSPWPRLLTLAVTAALGTTVAFHVLTIEPSQSRTQPEARPRAGSPPWHSGSTSSGPAGNRTRQGPQATATAPPPRLPGTPSHVALPLPAASTTPSTTDKRQWWTESSPNANRGAGPPNATAETPALSSYSARRALIAQCPRCGDFQLDMAGTGSAYAFRCRNPRCANTWTWTPGTAWPAVVVRRNLTRGSADRAGHENS